MVALSASASPLRHARVAALVLVLLIGLGFCALRVSGLRDRQDAAHEAAVTALDAALRAEPGGSRVRAFERAHEAAVDAMRKGGPLMDPQSAFLLSLVERLERAGGVSEQPPETASVFERLDWLIAHGALEEAQALAASARGSADLGAERLELYEALIAALRARR